MDLSEPGPVRAPDGQGRRFELHVFVCVNESACMQDGPAMEIRNLLKSKLKRAGLKERLRINKSGCLGQCGHGPMMVVYPEGVWYCHLDLDDAQRVWDEHLIAGNPVEDLMYRTPERGTNVLPMADARARLPDTEHDLYVPCVRCPRR